MKLNIKQLRRLVREAMQDEDGYDSFVGEVVDKMVDVFVESVKSDFDIVDGPEQVDLPDQWKADERHGSQVSERMAVAAQEMTDKLLPIAREIISRLRDRDI